jgi:chromosome segregation ATPase
MFEGNVDADDLLEDTCRERSERFKDKMWTKRHIEIFLQEFKEMHQKSKDKIASVESRHEHIEDDLKRDINTLKQEVEKASAERINHQQTVSDLAQLRHDHQELKQIQTASSLEVSNLQLRLEQFEKTENLSRQIEERLKVEERLRAENMEIRQQRESSVAQMNSLQLSLEHVSAENDEKIRGMERKLQDQVTVKQELRNEIDSLQHGNDSLTAEVSRLRATMDQLSTDSSLETQILKRKLQDKESIVRKLMAENEALTKTQKDRFVKMEKSFADVMKAAEGTKKETQRLVFERDSEMNRLATQIKESESRNGLVEAQEQKIFLLEKSITESQKLAEGRLLTIKELKSKFKNLNVDVIGYMESLRTLQSYTRELERENENYQTLWTALSEQGPKDESLEQDTSSR